MKEATPRPRRGGENEGTCNMQRRKVSAAFHDTIITQLGDDGININIKSTNFASNGAKLEPADLQAQTTRIFGHNQVSSD